MSSIGGCSRQGRSDVDRGDVPGAVTCEGMQETDTMTSSREGLFCHSCGHEWVPHFDNPPKRCPRCRSTLWNVPSRQVECQRCGMVWMSKDGKPRKCPSCGSFHWDTPPEYNRCLRCGNEWKSRGVGRTLKCYMCGSYQWDATEEDLEAFELVGVYDSSLVEDILDSYDSGDGCVRISIDRGIPFCRVQKVIRKRRGGCVIRM